MAQPYVGEIRLFGGNFAPAGWMDCSGQLLPISEYDILFNLIGTTYGGDGQATFALPDLQGRAPVHVGALAGGQTYAMGEKGGVESVTLSSQQIPAHEHAALTAATNQVVSPNGAIFADAKSQQAGVRIYSTNIATTTTLNSQSITPTGGSQPHENMQPFLVIRYIISLYGIYPSQT